MRHPTKRSPRNNGTAILLEDDASGTNVVAHWSTEVGQWVGESGEQPGITPTHRYPVPRDQYLRQEDERSRNQPQAGGRGIAAFWITVARVAAALMHFRAEVVAGETRYADQVDANQAGAPDAATRKELAPSAKQYRRALREEQRTGSLARELTATTEQFVARSMRNAHAACPWPANFRLSSRKTTARTNQGKAVKASRSHEQAREK